MKAFAVMSNKEFTSGDESYGSRACDVDPDVELNQLVIFRTREHAERAAEWWRDNTGDAFEVVEVTIT